MPVNKLLPAFIFWSADIKPIVDGSEPMREFLSHKKLVKDFILPILLGIIPVREFEETSKSDNEVR